MNDQAILAVAAILVALAIFLGVRALRIPWRFWPRVRAAARAPAAVSARSLGVAPAPTTPLPSMSEGALWAVRGRPVDGEYHNVSLLIGRAP